VGKEAKQETVAPSTLEIMGKEGGGEGEEHTGVGRICNKLVEGEREVNK